MKVEVADAEQCKKDLTIEVAADKVKAEFEKAYTTYARYAKVPGFRPGHVPITIVKQRFSKEVKGEVLDQLLPHALQHAIADHQLRVIGSPKIIEVTLSEGEPLRFKASIEVLPEFELREYKGLKLTKRLTRVTDEAVDRVLEDWREQVAQLVPVEDRPSQDGDFVSVNLIGKYVDPAEDEDLKTDNLVVELGDKNVQPEFNEHLRGVKVGDERTFRVAYPSDFTSPGLAGKTIDFTATVVAVRQKELPPLDQDFAKEFGEEETLAELREKIRADLKRNAEAEAERQLHDAAIEELFIGYEFPLPESLIERQTMNLMRDFARLLIDSGTPPEILREMDWESRQNEARQRANRDVRATLILERIGESEKIEVLDEEVSAEIARLAEAYDETEEAMRTRLTKEEGLSSIENRLRHQKILDVIISSAEVTVEETTETQPLNRAHS